MNVALYLALGWLVALVLAANAGIPAPDGLGLAILALTLWSLGYLYYRLARAGRLLAGSVLVLSLACLAAATTATRQPTSSANTTTAIATPTTTATVTHEQRAGPREAICARANQARPIKGTHNAERPDRHFAQAEAATGCQYSLSGFPRQLYLNMTITKVEHIEAL